jgi:hypothetical protein
MASADCSCCGQPCTVSEPPEFRDEFDCDCIGHDCDTCDWCFHECECGDCDECGDREPSVVLCSACEEDPCTGLAWHCTCGNACDGSACPGPPTVDNREPDQERRP